MAPFDSPYYPYEKLIAANTLRGAERLPYQLLRYLLDLPDAAGYQPVDDNARPRVRFAKYLWEDGPDPLSIALPTPEQKLSLLFDPDIPVLNTDEERRKHPKGYRLLWQRIRGQSQLDAQTLVKCYIGHIYEPKKFVTSIGIVFEIWCNVNFETNTRTSAYQRSFDVEQCLHEALDGVNIAGIGTVSFAQRDHSYNGSFIINDEAQNVGRQVTCSVTWAEGHDSEISGC